MRRALTSPDYDGDQLDLAAERQSLRRVAGALHTNSRTSPRSSNRQLRLGARRARRGVETPVQGRRRRWASLRELAALAETRARRSSHGVHPAPPAARPGHLHRLGARPSSCGTSSPRTGADHAVICARRADPGPAHFHPRRTWSRSQVVDRTALILDIFAQHGALSGRGKAARSPSPKCSTCCPAARLGPVASPRQMVAVASGGAGAGGGWRHRDPRPRARPRSNWTGGGILGEDCPRTRR